MNEIKTYQDAVAYLNNIYEKLNEDFFENYLPMPTITIQQKTGTYGHFTTDPNTWISSDGNSHEINISASNLGRDISAVCTTLVHEMCHYLAFLTGVKDTSNRGVYHNHNFKDIAQAHGLIVEKSQKYGYSHTFPGDEIKEFCKSHCLEDIKITRKDDFSPMLLIGTGSSITTTGISTIKKSSSQKMICPSCRKTLRVTRPDWNLKCLDCDEEMEYV